MNKPTNRPNYNSLAKYYDVLLTLSFGYLSKSQSILLPTLPKVQTALLIGEGTGNFLKSLFLSGKAQSMVYLDSSISMAEKARRKVRQLSKDISFVCGDINCFRAGSGFSLVTTNFFLDQFSNKSLDSIIPLIADRIRPGGLWLFTDFTTPKTLFQKLLISLLYFFFQQTCNIEAQRPPDYDHYFKIHGFVAIQKIQLRFGIRTILFRKTDFNLPD